MDKGGIVTTVSAKPKTDKDGNPVQYLPFAAALIAATEKALEQGRKL